MSISPPTLRQRLVDLASERYRAVGRFAYHFARGKLGCDPMFLGLLERGLVPDKARILDLGCGQGLLAAWLLAARQSYEAGQWPVGWPAPGQPTEIRGVDLLNSDIQRARTALGAPARFEQGDMRQVGFGQADVVVIMDVLHYVDIPAQDDVLRRVRAALPANGLFITRSAMPAPASPSSSATGLIARSPSFAATACRPLTAARCASGSRRWSRSRSASASRPPA